jgi:methionyl-tRNA formyltransferase
MKEYKRIIVIGDGWGAVAVLKGLKNFILPVYVVSNDENVLAIAEQIADADLSLYHDELLLFAGYKPIVPKEVLNTNCCINIHYSLLPQYRGLHSTVWAILNNEDYLGATIHLMNVNIDDGPIIYQYKVANDRVKTSTQYMQLFNAHISECIGQVLCDFIDEKIFPQKQDKSQASWVGKRNEKDCMLDCTKPIAYQKAFFRALVSPYPLPYIIHKEQKYVVTKVSFHPSSVQTHIGRILNIDNEGIWVKIADGYMIIQELRDESNVIVPYSKFRIGQYINKFNQNVGYV